MKKLEELKEKYPVIFSKISFEHDHGWYELLDELGSQLTTIMNKVGLVVTAEQVKEKFGTLRFYYSLDFKELPDSEVDGWNEIISGLVSKAELHSSHVCERCGEYGEIRPGGWIRTLCDECAKN